MNEIEGPNSIARLDQTLSQLQEQISTVETELKRLEEGRAEHDALYSADLSPNEYRAWDVTMTQLGDTMDDKIADLEVLLRQRYDIRSNLLSTGHETEIEQLRARRSS